MVFSTLHTMNAIATVNRLLDLGVEGYMIAAAIHGIIAQRLVRRVCEQCSQPAEPDAHQLAWLEAHIGRERAANYEFRLGAGCTYCNLSGYRGRVAVYELLELDRSLGDTIRRGDLTGFADAARTRPGYVSLGRSALVLAGEGVTSLAEVISVTSGIEEAQSELLEDALLAEARATSA
jgi:MSHA biogenesis protein MshE